MALSLWTGEVNNLLAKERAARVAETVRGVRAVVNTITMSPAALRLDDEIRQDVERALQTDQATRSYSITTTVERGEVTLTGSVGNEVIVDYDGSHGQAWANRIPTTGNR